MGTKTQILQAIINTLKPHWPHTQHLTMNRTHPKPLEPPLQAIHNLLKPHLNTPTQHHHPTSRPPTHPKTHPNNQPTSQHPTPKAPTMLKLHNTTDTCSRPTGENDTLNCGVCNTQMTVKRNINTGNPQYNYDQFTCPHKNQPWHKQIVNLRQEQQKTPSRTITNLLEKEIQTIQQTRKPTK